MFEKKSILGVGITNARLDEVLEYIITGLKKGENKYFVVTPNPEILTLANTDLKYKNILNKAKIALADGVGIIMAGKILGIPFKARVTGVDLLESLCKKVAEKPITVGFLGGKDNIADKTGECLVKKYPGLKVSFVGQEWPSSGSVGSVEKLDGRRWKIEDSSLKMEDRRSIYPPTSTFKKLSSTFYHLPSNTIDILFVAFGAPKQERWIYENLDKIPVKVAIGVGGAFDYISGEVSRAPVWMRKIGLEWAFRLVRQPWRIKRQIALLKFIYMVFKEKIS